MEYKPTGVCSRAISIDVEDNIIKNISFVGGCDGNLKGLSSLLKGMKVEDAIERMEGITCGPRPTSCPDQVSLALRTLKS
ncbi:MAG: TIGR03905 family TSCPD domain-containing protein [Eubacteriales bacterium]